MSLAALPKLIEIQDLAVDRFPQFLKPLPAFAVHTEEAHRHAGKFIGAKLSY